ncbi:XRE family transcriptional regulator [Streptomyces enissocaesilis]|uniref:HTH cro/C1-type domain-containing protein n=1 Tax=Streptomyces enissocaesilis TaxID=332589 RepID=A0ABP6JYC3_9ACTN
MPRWKDLPEELDPQVKEFTDQLRRLVDRSGLGVSAVADRTGYSKTSWERYLNGRLLAPRGAVLALAEVTGTNAVHLTTMWELAEHAWSRSEMRHDMTMEAIRVSQARAALGGSGRTAAPIMGGGPGRRTAGTGTGGRTPQDFGTPRQRTGRGPGPGRGAGTVPGPGSPDGRRGHRKVAMFLAGVVGALLVMAAVVLLTDLGGEGKDKDLVLKDKPTARPATSAPGLPLGVECSGDACTGKDPETMGCGGEFAETTASATVGTSLVEVRYSKTCGAAWARITRAAVGDTVRITRAGTAEGQNGLVDADKDAYTPMVAVTRAGDAKACATLASGVKGCATQEQPAKTAGEEGNARARTGNAYDIPPRVHGT